MDVEALRRPLSVEQPCGISLEDTQLLASFDAYRVFGQTALSADLEWRTLQTKALEALGQSKDLRLLAYLSAAALRTEGIEIFVQLLSVAAGWLEGYWQQLYPLVDEDAVLRRNALNSFADNLAILDPLRRVALASHRQLGNFSLRDAELASGRLTAAEGERRPSDEQLRAAFSAADPAAVKQMDDMLAAALQSARQIANLMADKGGTEAAPDLSGLDATLGRMRQVLKPFVRSDSTSGSDAAASAGALGSGSAAGGSGAAVPGAIRTREDAVRALEAVAAFFRATEPSSPVPLFVERAKRLVARDFLEVLADVVPDALGEARRLGGIKEE